MAEMGNLFVKMVGTLAVLIVVAFFVGGSDVLSRLADARRTWKNSLLLGLMGGIFGIYGNLAGINLGGAVVSIRDVGPMLAGFLGGPYAGLLAGLIAGAHRLTMGGITATACIIATCLIGTICGLLSRKYHDKLIRPKYAFPVGALMEMMHLSIVLLIVKPFSTAWDIVSQIAIPFILINAAGFTALIFIIVYIQKYRKNEMEQSRLQSELEAATTIQHSLLPPISDRFPGREEIGLAASMNAAKEVGGDFYDFFFIDRDHMAVVIADVSGKGIPAALFMANAKQTLQNCIRDIPNFSEAVSTANNSLCENNEMEMFVTAWIGILDIPTGQVEYICAGHNPPVLISGSRAVFVKGRSGIVLAGMEEFCYVKQTVQMKPGDMLYLYTDGVTEAEDTGHGLYGEDRLLSCLQGGGDLSADDVLRRVREDVDRHVKGADQFDDMTMLCLQYRGPAGTGGEPDEEQRLTAAEE